MIVKGNQFLKIGLRGSKGNNGLAEGLLASWIFILVSKFFYSTPLALEFMFWFLPALMLTRINADPLARISADSSSESIGDVWSYRFQQGSTKTLAIFFALLAMLVVTLAGTYFSIRRWGAERTFVKAITLNNTNTASGEADQNAEQLSQKINEVLNGISAAIVSNPY